MIGHSKKLFASAALLLAALAAGPAAAAPTVYPTGTTIYQPDKTFNGYTVLTTLGTPAVLVIDMDGRVVKRWDGFSVFAGAPARVLPGGVVIATQGAFPGHLENNALVAEDFDGKELWRIDCDEQITVDGKQVWSARQHHDWQLSDFPAGYYSPDYTPQLSGGRTLLLTHTTHRDPKIADVVLDDDKLIERDASGKITWQWRVGDHIGDFGFSDAARAAIRRDGKKDGYDWFHMNSVSYVGPNKWFDAGDKRFAPDNVIISSRQASLVAIVARDGEIVWQIGPDFLDSPLQARIGQIIGQHNVTMIPKGLPGAGDLLLFDNGGASGYGAPSPIAPDGQGIYARDSSRVLEIDPVTLEVVWSYKAFHFYSMNISGAQRLPNGNTLITEGASGRIFEVTPGNKIVWEFMNPPSEGRGGLNSVYRAYRIPYSWIPQLPVPKEQAIELPEPGKFHVPGSPQG